MKDEKQPDPHLFFKRHNAFRHNSQFVMSYALYFRDTKVGTVAESGSDFPNLWGTIEYDGSIGQPTSDEEERLAKFVELTRESIRLVDVEHEQDVSEELRSLNKQLEAFNEYAESDEWVLVSESGKHLPILCPILRHGGGIVWRWNPGDSLS